MGANKASTRTTGGKSGLDLIEEATQLLRKGGLQALLPFYVGSIPAVIGLLYFCSDMSRGAFAQARLIESAFGIAALYLWMKCWHAGFLRGLRYRLALQTPPPWTPPCLMRMAVVQMAVQPSGLFVRLIAAFILVPYVWVYAFYQNVSVFGDGEEAKLRDVLRQAATQAHLWPRQAHFALFFSFAFALLVALNIFVTILLAPQLLRTLFGWETIFSQRPLALLNTTVFVTVGALTYLCFDPLRKALFVVRCFYGTALQSGDDLRVGLRVLQMKARTITLAALFLFAAIPALAQSAGGAGTAAERVDLVARVDAARLDRSIKEVLSRREYTWRLPREKTPESQKGWLTAFVEDLLRTVLDWARKGVRLVEKLFDRLRAWFGAKERGTSKPSWHFADAAPALLYGLVVIGILLLAFVLWRARGRNRKSIVAAQAAAPVPDLRSEEIVADQLPEDGWLKLACEMMEAGELRLALRASYLAALAHLGRRDLITVARYKTNLDYETELRRRARSDDRLITAFDENMRAFERAWYGWHEVTSETLGSFNRNLERIRGC